MKKSTAVLVFLFGIVLTSFAQVTDVKYLIEYNNEIEKYDCKIYIAEGETTSYPERIQFNAQYTIVVPTGSQVTIDTLYNPKENNQFYTGTVPCLWEFGATEIAPPTQPEHDFYAVFPNLSPPSAYDDLSPGDTITLFSISVDVDPCENAVRPFINGVDPDSAEFPGGGDFSNGFAFGGGGQVYSGNLYSEYENAYIAPNDSLEICIGECIVLEPTIACLGDSLHYEWSTGDTTETIEICPTETTNYYLIVKDEDDNELDSIPLFVDFGSLIIPPENESICAGLSMILMSCTENVAWLPSASNPAGAILSNFTSTQTTVTFTEAASGIYNFICSIPGKFDTVSITVYPIPEIFLSANETCVGATEIATSSIEEGTWEGFNPSIASISQSGLISTYSEGVATFMFTTFDGCSSISDPLLITSEVDASFSGPDMICLGETTTVVPSIGGTWVSADYAIATVTNSGLVTGVGYGTTQLVFADVDGCYSNYLTVHVSGSTLDPPASNEICVGGTTTISPSTGGTWTSNDPSVAAIDNAGTITGISPGSANFTFTSAATGCPSLPSQPVQIVLGMEAMAPSSFLCGSETMSLIPSFGGTWVSSAPGIATVNALTGVVTPISNGSVVFTYTNASTGCISYTEEVIIGSPPFLNVYNNGPLCEGEDLELAADFVSGATYSWTGPNGYASSDQNPVLSAVDIVDSGEYCMIATINGCESNEVCTLVSILPTPITPTASNNTPICEGEDLLLTTNIVIGATYRWTGPNGFVSYEQNPVIIGATPAASGTYCVIISIDGCDSGEACTDVFINSESSAPNIVNNSPVCEGQNIELSTASIQGASYSWTGPNGFTSTDQNLTISNATTFHQGIYCLVVSIDGCDSQQECTDVVVHLIPSTPILSANSPLCEGNTINLTANAITDATYSWTGPNGFTSSQQNPVITDATTVDAGSYCLTVSINDCESDFSCTEIVVNAVPNPPSIHTISPICEGEDIELSTDFIAGATYAWFDPSGAQFSELQNAVISGATIAEAGMYCLSISIDGCESMVTCVDVNVINCLIPFENCSQIESDDIICDFDKLVNISGVLSDQISGGEQPAGSLCDNDDEVQNAAWFAFVALEGEYELVINSEVCENENQPTGLKVSVYSSCEFIPENVVYCETNFNSGIETRIASTFFTTGETYYLSLDGYEGSICDYRIDVEGFYDNTYCTDLSKVTGVAYIDENENGTYEDGETLLRNALISLFPGNFSVLTNDEGKYIINTPKGGATLTAKMNEGYWINDELVIEDLTIFEDCVEGINFGFVPNLFYQEAKVSVSNTITRCDWETRFYFTIENTGTIEIEPKFEFEFDDKASYFSTNLIGLQTNGNIASADISVMQPFEVREFWVLLKMPAGSAVLPILDFKTSIANSAGVEMDRYEYSEQLRCSYDPNDKREYPDREGEDNLTLMDEELEYTIRFQNNGNDTAFLVKIVDPIDTNIDPSSIRVINSSHEVETCIENENLIFLFEDIYLVDSMTNYEGSQGFVSFRCNTKEGRAENTIVHNTADIIFDSNLPIVTNTTINTLVSELCTNVTSEVDIEICDGEEYNGWSESGTYTEVFPLAFGCDSIVMIHLDVQGITYSAQDITVCEGDPFEVNGVEYILYESQEIRDSSINAIGCISDVYIFDIVVNPIQQIHIDTTICEGLEYQGLTESGVYTLDSFDVVTGCDITTTVDLEVLPLSDPACLVGIDDLNFSEVKLYPNPVLDVYFIESVSDVEKVTIYSIDYQKIQSSVYPKGAKKIQLNAENLVKGMYFIAIESNGKLIYKKLLKN